MGAVKAALRVQVLGPVRAWRDGQELNLGPPRQRSVLAVLAMAAGQAVPRLELVDAVWDAPTDRAHAALYAYISRLRAVLEPGRDPRGPARVLVSEAPGYLLRVEPGQVDAAVFAGQVAAAHRARGAGELAATADLLEQALGLWRGTALAGMDGPWARQERLRLEDARLAGVEERAEVKLALGDHAEAAGELARWVGRYPLREGLAALLMVALYRCARQAEALGVFHDTRRVLAAELGIEPGPELRRLHERILAGDPALDPPARAAGAATAIEQPAPVPRELPGDVAGFTGRVAELAALDALGPAAAGQQANGTPGPVVISVVSGTAGVGKTALAVRWAHRVRAVFPDGQLYVNLRGYDPGRPMPAAEALAGFLRAMGVADQAIPLDEAERAARFRSLVAGRRLLVLLDNAATVEQVRPLLPGAESVMVMVTSRDALAGLVTRDGARRLDLDLLPAADAVALLRTLIGERVSADPAATQALAAQCARLPLALRVAAELAAARPGTPLAELSAELASLPDRVRLLDPGGDMRSAVASVFSWSYRHLPPDAAQMFRLLSLHPGADWDMHAAAALTGMSAAEAGRLLGGLARAHLIQLTTPASSRRYGMHDLLRGYAASLAADCDSDLDQREALTRLFDYYLATCTAAMDVLAPAARGHRPGSPPAVTPARQFSDQATAHDWLDAELATLVAVAAHSAGQGWPGHTIQLAETLRYYLDGEHNAEAFTIHSHALDAARNHRDHAAQVLALANLGNLHSQQGRNQQAVAYARQAIEIAREAGDRAALSRALMTLAVIHYRQARYQEAAGCYQESLALTRELGDQLYEALNLTNLGNVYLRLGHYRQAAGYQERALALFREIGHQRGEAVALVNLGEACYRRGSYQQAASHQRQALVVSGATGDRYTEAGALVRLGEICHRQGRYGQAAASHERALALCQEIGDPEMEADALNAAGATLLATGQPGQARARHTAALTLTRQTGDRYQQARTLIRLGEVDHRQGHHDQAADHHQRAVALCRELGDQGGETEALNGAGETLLAAGQPDQARTCHTAALTLTRRTGDRYQQARAHLGLAQASDAIGQPGQARRHRQQAEAIYSDLDVPKLPRAVLTE